MTVIYFLFCECEWEGVVTDVMYIVYACVLCVIGFGHAIFHWASLFGTLFCYVGGTWAAVHGEVVLCEELIQNPGKYCPVLLLKKSERLMISSSHQRVEKYCK